MELTQFTKNNMMVIIDLLRSIYSDKSTELVAQINFNKSLSCMTRPARNNLPLIILSESSNPISCQTKQN